MKSCIPAVRLWLFVGVVMVFVQIILGGSARLTGSGLSITRWEIVTGTIPPLNAKQWQEAFDLYKQTPQYHKINYDMDLEEFKTIYWWEYVHRLWARLMGFVFLIPFLYFYFKGMLYKGLLRRLGVVVLLAVLAASMGWIMVASGLVDRPWVNAYKLSLHLGIGIAVFGYLLRTAWFETPMPEVVVPDSLVHSLKIFLVFLFLQILVGGAVSGMKAAIYYPTWPQMNGEWIPSVLLQSEHWTWDNLKAYDTHRFAPALIQFTHRSIAYILWIAAVYFLIKYHKRVPLEVHLFLLFLLMVLTIQLILGIYTVLNSRGYIPVTLGVFHQMGAVVTLAVSYSLYHWVRYRGACGLDKL